MYRSDISRGSIRTASIAINNSPDTKDIADTSSSTFSTDEPAILPKVTPKIRGRPSKLQLLQRERSHSFGSIRDFVIAKRKRSQSPHKSPDCKETRVPKAFKKSSKTPRSPCKDCLSEPPDAQPVELPSLPTASTTPASTMEQIMEELRKMGEANARQFNNMGNQLNEVKNTHEKNFEEIKEELRKSKEEFAKAHENLEARIKGIEEKENARGERVQARLDTLEAKMDSTPKMDHETNRRIHLLERKFETMEKSQIKNNIVIKGIKADPKNVTETLNDFLSTEFGAAGKIIEHRTIPVGRNYMYAVKLDSWETKADILKKKKRLRGREIYVNGELTYNERQIGKQLRDLAKQHREEGSQVKIAYKKLEIDGIWHFWDEKDATLKKAKNPPPFT